MAYANVHYNTNSKKHEKQQITHMIPYACKDRLKPIRALSENIEMPKKIYNIRIAS